VAASVKLEWSAAALADLDRFAAFLHQRHPSMAAMVASEILVKVRIIAEHPQLGRPVKSREHYREVLLRILNATYAFRYRYDGKRIVMLRVFHSREERD
jgi:toxin ParE1/3/4